VKVDVAEGDATNIGFLDLDEPDTSSSSGGNTQGVVPLLGQNSACAIETRAAEQRRVAMYIMLDSSGSMEEPTGNGSTKWEAIQRAVRSFLSETKDTDLSIGLQFFPLLKPGASFTCRRHSDCGPDGGPCFLSTCAQGETITLCTSNDDCPGSDVDNPCVTFGLCENGDPAAPLACVLGDRCRGELGACEDFERVCTQATQCDWIPYATPAVEIGLIADQIGVIDQALSVQPLQGLTPSGPALRGATEHAREWALTHPDQAVVAVLATDGLPTECVPPEDGPVSAIGEVANIASQAQEGENPVRTFVIGVFQPGDGVSINNLNTIAAAGGTDEAVFIDTSGDVGEQFLEALRAVRSNTLACEFKVPESDSQLDYNKVNLQFDNGTERRQLAFVRNPSDCGANPGSWHYDVDPALGKPTAIEVCPDVCNEFATASTGSISLQLGCATIIR
jgi:hypothetical protein